MNTIPVRRLWQWPEMCTISKIQTFFPFIKFECEYYYFRKHEVRSYQWKHCCCWGLNSVIIQVKTADKVEQIWSNKSWQISWAAKLSMGWFVPIFKTGWRLTKLIKPTRSGDFIVHRSSLVLMATEDYVEYSRSMPYVLVNILFIQAFNDFYTTENENECALNYLSINSPLTVAWFSGLNYLPKFSGKEAPRTWAKQPMATSCSPRQLHICVHINSNMVL